MLTWRAPWAALHEHKGKGWKDLGVQTERAWASAEPEPMRWPLVGATRLSMPAGTKKEKEKKKKKKKPCRGEASGYSFVQSFQNLLKPSLSGFCIVVMLTFSEIKGDHRPSGKAGSFSTEHSPTQSPVTTHLPSQLLAGSVS